MHKALKLKRVADALAAAGGGWLPLTLKAWRKYVRRKRGKENARPALVAKPPVEALPPPPPVEPALDAAAKLQPPSPPLCQTYEAPPVPPPPCVATGALRVCCLGTGCSVPSPYRAPAAIYLQHGGGRAEANELSSALQQTSFPGSV